MSALNHDAVSGLDFVAVGATEKPKHVLVMLHGSGSDYSDMEAAAGIFTDSLPADTVILVPNAPFKFADILPAEQAAQLKASLPEGMDINKMRSWFDAAKSEGLTQDEVMEGVRAKTLETVGKLNEFIDSQLKGYGLSAKDVAVYGFSQGGVLALQAGIERMAPAAAVVSHSGYLLGADYAFSKPRTLMMVGDQELVEGHPMKEMHALSVDFLREMGVPVTEHVSPGLGHGLNMDTVAVATAFITKAFEGPTAEAKKDLSATFAKFAAREVPVRELFEETEESGRHVVYVEILNRNSDLINDFRQAALEAGFRDIRILTPGHEDAPDDTADRLTATLAADTAGKYRLGGFRAG